MKQNDIILVIAAQSAATGEIRKQLRAAIQELGIMPVWRELVLGDRSLPQKYQDRSEPFVLVNKKAVDLKPAEKLAEAIQSILAKSARLSWIKKPLAAGSIIPGILLAFFPKCAVCWAAYFSVFSSMGIGIPYSPWLQHVLAGTLVISAIYFAWMAKRRNKWLPFIFQMMGFAAVLISQYAIDVPSLLWVGVGFVFIGSLLYAMPHAWMQKLEKRFKPKQYSSYTS